MKRNLFLMCLAMVLVIGCADAPVDSSDLVGGDELPPVVTPQNPVPGEEMGGPGEQEPQNPENPGDQSGDGVNPQDPGDPGTQPEIPPEDGKDPVDDGTKQGEGDGDQDGGVAAGDCCAGITGVEKGTCSNSVCVIESCVVGYHLNAKKECKKDSKVACGVGPVNCNDLIDTEGYEHAGVMGCTEGQCIIKSCMDSYELKDGQCEAKADGGGEYGGGKNCRDGWITVSTYEMSSKLCFEILEDEKDIENVANLYPNLPVSNSGKYEKYYCMKGNIDGRYCRHVPEADPNSLLVIHPGQYCTEEQANPGTDTLRIHMMDIGQGDSIWIQTPTGQNVLIDGGDGGAFGKTSAGPIVTDYLNSHGFPYGSTFDAVILTHPHSDHFGGFNNIFNTNNKATHYKLANYLDPMNYTHEDSASYSLPSSYIQWIGRVKKFLPEKSGKQNAHVYMPAQNYFKAGDSFPAEFFGSEVQTQYILSHNTFKGDDANPASIIFKLSYKGVSFLFTGDAEKEQEKEAVATGIDLSSNFLKVCHHGSSTSSTTQLLDAIWDKIKDSSRFALISSGRKTYSGSYIPTSEVIERLKKYLSEDHIYSTSAEDDKKIETESYRDDNILVVVKPDGSYYACYNGTN